MSLPVPVSHSVQPMPFTPRLAVRIFFKGWFRWFYEQRKLIRHPKCVAVKRLRTFPTANIQIATECQVPWVKPLLLKITTPSDARFTYIIKGSPDKIAEQPWMIGHIHPAFKCFQWIRFGLHHYPRRNPVMIDFKYVILLVIAT